MHETLEEEMDNEQNNQEEEPGTTEQKKEPLETIHIHYFPDAIVIVKEDTESRQEESAVETTLAQTTKPPVFIAYAVCVCYLLLMLSTLAFQFYIILNPPSATITIIPKSEQMTLTGTLHLGRVVSPLTISQSQAVPTTGKGHQDAKQAHGAITFYNGQLTGVTVLAGTILTASNGVQVVTEQEALIPAESQTIPPTLGQTTVSAHTLVPGVRGNIPPGDINQSCCSPSVLAQNTTSFHGGLNERDFQTVTQQDIASTAAKLKTTVGRSMQAAIEAELTNGEERILLPCTPTVTSDHQPEQEATSVTVTVSQTCSAVAYNSRELETKATYVLIHQTGTKLATSYSLMGDVTVTVSQATVQKHVLVSFAASGTWVYTLGNRELQEMKRLIAGKTTHQAVQLVSSLQGIAGAAIAWDETTKLPKDTNLIHFIIVQSG